MENAQTIYQQTIITLPDSEQLRLASIILRNLTESETKTESAYDFLEKLSGDQVFSTSQEVDEHLRTERESWDN